MIPIAIRLKAPRHRPIDLTAGTRAQVHQLAGLLGHFGRWSQCRIDPRLFTIRDLAEAGARGMRDLVMGLDEGQAALAPLGPGEPVMAAVRSPWALRYLVGALRHEVGQPLDLETPEGQERVGCLVPLAGGALEKALLPMMTQGVKGQINPLGFYYACQGFRVGADRLRRHQLKSFLWNLLQVEPGLRLCYTQETARIRILAAGPAIADKFSWETYGIEGTETFVEELNEALELLSPRTPVVPVSGNQYQVQLKAAGVCCL